MTELRVRNLSVRIGGQQILSNVSFDAASRDVIGLIGPNGTGKSTLLKAILGFVASTGEIEIFGSRKLSARERARKVCYVPQDRDIAWPLTVHNIVSLGRTPFLASTKLSGADKALVSEAMKQMDIEHLSGRNVLELSGGERARVLVARALAQNAPLLIADEPAAGLDPAHQIALMEMIVARTTCQGLAIVTVHDMALAARWCTRLLVLHDGCLVADGPPTEVLIPEMFARVYGVDVSVTSSATGPIVHTLGLINSLPSRQNLTEVTGWRKGNHAS